MKMKYLLVAAVMIMVASGLMAQNGRFVTVVDSREPKRPCNTSDNGGEAAAIAAGALIVTTSAPVVSAPPPVACPPPAAAPAPCPSPAPKACNGPAPKRPGFLARAFRNVGLWFTVSGNIGSTGTYSGGEYWVANDADYYRRYCGDDRVFVYGPSSYSSSSYTYVDNYRSGSYPAVRFLPDAPLGRPFTPYNNNCAPRGPRPGHSGPSHQGGGGGGRPHR